MNSQKSSLALAFLLGALPALALGQDVADRPVTVTVDNFVRAESDMYMRNLVKSTGGIGQLARRRQLAPVEARTVLRPNRDTYYSIGVFDLDAGPVSVTLPAPGQRFMSMQIVNEDHYTPVPVVYRAGTYRISREQVGTRYAVINVRLLGDPNDARDLAQAFALQDAIKVEQARRGSFEVPAWDAQSQAKVRQALFALGGNLDSKGMFGSRDEVDPIRHLIGTATAWGGNNEKDALYLSVTPPRNDGATFYRLTVKDVPVDGFWSTTVYTADGYFQPNAQNAYSLNSITAKRSADGSVTIQFGGCDGQVSNCLPITSNWNYLVRLYRPRAEILDGKWAFPQALAVD
ncbi:hypothetical protein D3C78_329520 [compost metagenome]